MFECLNVLRGARDTKTRKRAERNERERESCPRKTPVVVVVFFNA